MPSGFCPHNRAVDEMGNCFEQKFAQFWTATSVICWLFSLGAPGTRSKRCVSYILIHQGLPHFIWKNVLVVYVRVDPVSFYIFNMQPTRWWSVNNSVSLLTGASNTDLNKSWNYPKINHWPLNQRVFVPGVLEQICVGKGVHDAKCFVAARIFRCHLSFLRHIDRSHLFAHQRRVHWRLHKWWWILSFHHSQGITGFLLLRLLRSWVGSHTCMKHRERSINFSLTMHKLPPNEIHSSTQPVRLGFASIAIFDVSDLPPSFNCTM